MDIKITITSPDLHDALLALAEAISNAGLPWGNPVAASAPQPDPAVSRTQQQATAAQYAPEAMHTQPAAPQPAAPQEYTPAAPQEYTLQQIAIWAVALQERNLPRLRQILAAFGVQSLTQLPKEQYGAFVDALAAEGVTTDAR